MYKPYTMNNSRMLISTLFILTSTFELFATSFRGTVTFWSYCKFKLSLYQYFSIVLAVDTRLLLF